MGYFGDIFRESAVNKSYEESIITILILKIWKLSNRFIRKIAQSHIPTIFEILLWAQVDMAPNSNFLTLKLYLPLFSMHPQLSAIGNYTF